MTKGLQQEPSAAKDGSPDGASLAQVPTGLPPLRPWLDDLIEAYEEPKRPRYDILRKNYENAWNAVIEEQYYTRNAKGVILLLRDKTYGVFFIKIFYDSGIANPMFDEIARELYSEQLQSTTILEGNDQNIVAKRAYSVLVSLLRALDAYLNLKPANVTQAEERLKATVTSARAELEAVRSYVRQATRKIALGRYLTGLPIGIVVIVAVIVLISWTSFSISAQSGGRALSICLGAGALGAVISVMARITLGQRVDIDTDQNRLVTAMAGAFRPLIGAVFGAALYTLILGGIIPLAIPNGSGGGGVDTAFFFAGIAFLAGFSERWAQDTIVQSAPKSKVGG